MIGTSLADWVVYQWEFWFSSILCIYDNYISLLGLTCRLLTTEGK